jgi:hypothetical protein
VKLRLFLATLAILILFGVFFLSNSFFGFTDDKKAIYSALCVQMLSEYPGSSILFVKDTHSYADSLVNVFLTLQSIKSNFPQIDYLTLAEYGIDNFVNLKITLNENLDPKCVLISREDADYVTAMKDKRQVVVSFSNIALNASFDKAVLEVNMETLGFLQYFEKIDGRWIPKANIMSWID